MASISGNTGLLRIDASRANEYLYADKPKTSFWKKLGRGVGKAFSFLGPIGAAITAVAVPGAGVPIAAGLYGLSKLSGDLTNSSYAKDQAEMDAYNAETAKMPITLPGLFEQASQVDITTDFMVPSELSSGVIQTVGDREVSVQSSVEGFEFY